MNKPIFHPAKPRPHDIHPLLWRASSVATGTRKTVSTGFSALNALLPGQGWPLGSPIEILVAQTGTAELSLVYPALAQLSTDQPIALVNPPLQPFMQCFWNWQLGKHRWLWLSPRNERDALWACEQLLKNNICSALLCWVSVASSTSVRRLQLAAEHSSTLCLLTRPSETRQTTSPVHLRVLAQACPQGIKLKILKRQGPAPNHFLTVSPFSDQLLSPIQHHHGSLDRSLPAMSAFSPRTGERIAAASGKEHARFHS